jgi:hypothetical protein
MRRSNKRKVSTAADSPAVLGEEYDVLRPGDVVMLPDGGVAAIERIVGRDAYVVEWQKQAGRGRGPWIFPLSELVLVS